LAASRGQLPAAIELMQRTITDAVQTLGADNDELGTLHFNLGRMYMLQGRHDQAAASLERSLALEQQRRGPTHPALAEVLAMIAEIEVHRQRAPAAITHLRRARSLAGTQRHRLRAEVGLVHAQLHIDCDLATAQRDAHKLIDAARPEAPSIPGLSDDLDRMAQLVEGWRDDEHLPACRPTPNHRPAQPDSPR
ncbi:MAG: tetratricopeptide repeat protein, partial [Deltaproteobacteria bacterium]|nr:tetratricopeptide repeat protein [Deltaproteobacteria bacterium]